MPRSNKPRRRYRPRGVNPTAHLVAILGAALLSLDDRTVWAMELDDAITNVGRAQATEEQWEVVFNAVALAEQLVLDRLALDAGGVIAAAQEACRAILTRSGTRAVKSTELAALRALQEDWIDLLAGLSHSQKFQAEERIAARRQSPHNVKVPRPCP